MKQNDIQVWVMVGLASVFLVGFGGKAIYEITHPRNDIIKFEVTGIKGAVNATTLVSVHFECIKYCIENELQSMRNECFSRCATLGAECSLEEKTTTTSSRFKYYFDGCNVQECDDKRYKCFTTLLACSARQYRPDCLETGYDTEDDAIRACKDVS